MKIVTDAIKQNKNNLGGIGDLLTKGFDVNKKNMDFCMNLSVVITVSVFMNNGFGHHAIQMDYSMQMGLIHGTLKSERLTDKGDKAV